MIGRSAEGFFSQIHSQALTLCCTDNNGLTELGMEAGEGGDSGGKPCLGKLRILREWEQTATAGWGVFPEPADAVCGQQCADGDIALRTNEEVGEPEPSESGQGKTVGGCLVVHIGIVQ